MHLNEELIKQIFFQSDRPRKDAMIADEVDIVQFAEKLEAVLRPMIAREEHQRCVVRPFRYAVQADAVDRGEEVLHAC